MHAFRFETSTAYRSMIFPYKMNLSTCGTSRVVWPSMMSPTRRAAASIAAADRWLSDHEPQGALLQAPLGALEGLSSKIAVLFLPL